MKKSFVVIAMTAFFAVVGTAKASAQNYGYYIVSFQCDPISCEEQGPTATTSYAETLFYVTCSPPDAPDFDIDSGAEAYVGIPTPCNAPYTPVASIATSTSDFLDDNGQEYQVWYVNSIAEIFTASGQIDNYGQADWGCDGSYATYGTGAKPC